jgi:uncharacterized protein (DUF697 family)
MQSQYEWESNGLEVDQYEYEGEMEVDASGEMESPFDEVEEMELASTLLEVTDEAELDQFIGDLLKKAGRAVGTFVKSSTGRALGGILKGAARKALPVVGGAIGGAIGGSAGGALGGRLASGAGRLFGLELEGLSAEDQEFEVARQYVRFAGAAAKKAALTPPRVPPQEAAKAAAVTAAQQYAPGMIRGKGGPSPMAAGGLARTGRWFRRGRYIIIENV